MTIMQEAPVPAARPELAELALDLCVDDALAARYRLDPAAVLVERGLPIEAGVLLGATGPDATLTASEARVPGITWCFSTPDGGPGSVA